VRRRRALQFALSVINLIESRRQGMRRRRFEALHRGCQAVVWDRKYEQEFEIVDDFEEAEERAEELNESVDGLNSYKTQDYMLGEEEQRRPGWDETAELSIEDDAELSIRGEVLA
jgi:hypothetical protein